MPSVAEELAALRAQSLTKAHASKLKDANGLSTPEQEEAAIKDSFNKTSIGTYSKDAVETLHQGKYVVDQDFQVRLKQSALKKQDMEKKKEAAKNLQAFKLGATTTATGSSVSSPTAASTTPSTSEETTTTTPEVTSPPSAPTPVDTEETTTNDAVDDDDDEDDDEIPDLDEAGETVDMISDDMMPTFDATGAPTTTGMMEPTPRIPNRAEKKSRKIMERLGMTPVKGISRVTLKMQGNQGFFTIFRPDVYEKSGSYVVFGEARQGTGMPSPQAQAASQLSAPVNEPKAVTESVEDVDDTIDESGVEAADIDLVVSQVGCSRAKAVKALKDNGGDIVNTIMSLTD